MTRQKKTDRHVFSLFVFLSLDCHKVMKITSRQWFSLDGLFYFLLLILHFFQYFYSLSLLTRGVFFGRPLSCYFMWFDWSIRAISVSHQVRLIDLNHFNFLPSLIDRFEPLQSLSHFDWSIWTTSVSYPVWLIDLNHFNFLSLLCAGSSSMIRRVILPGYCGQAISGWVLPLFILRFCL